MNRLFVGLIALFFASGAHAADNGHPDFTCFQCHSRQRVMEPKSDEARGLREHLLASEGGLKLVEPFVPDLRDHYAFDFPRRGRHPDPDMPRKECFACHKMNELGVGHGRRLYPAGTELFAPGQDCASQCHDWLKENVASAGPDEQEHKGTIRPHDLLMQDDNPHRKIYLEGFRQPLGDNAAKPEIRIAGVNPGCGGCHSLRGAAHGETPDCVDCHHFAPSSTEGKQVAGTHDKMIELAIERGTGGGLTQSCAMCHESEKDTPTYFRAACYNCHLSAHNPLTSTGPQLWRP